jgi:magnesium-transporting ATPase (P-type)
VKSGKNKPVPKTKNSWINSFVKIFFAALGFSALAVWVYKLIHLWRSRRKPPTLESNEFILSHHGLSTSEVEARQTDEAQQTRIMAEKEAKKDRWRRNTFSIFNVTIIVLAISQVLLKDPLGALATIGTLILSVTVNIFQETRAARRVEALASQARPMAAVIRDGRLQSIDQDDLVVGDVMVAGKGDEILADGYLLESANLRITGSKSGQNTSSFIKKPGDALIAGTYCETGWAIYRADLVNIPKPEKTEPAKLLASVRDKTPLQKIIERVLYVLLVIVGFFYINLFLEVIRIEIFSPELLATYREVMTVIFSILPSGLLLMIVINYAVGSADIARSDVLVHNSQTIESLAQVSTVGFIRHGGAMGLTIELEMLPASFESLKISERRIRQALGNYVHSIPGEQYPLSIIREYLEGEPRSIHQQARYLSLYGWEAMTFSSADMPGSFVIGSPEALAPYLEPSEPPDLSESVEKPAKNKSGGIVGKMRKWFGRRKTEKKNVSEQASDEPKNLDPEPNTSEDKKDMQQISNEKGVDKGFLKRFSGLFKRKEKVEQPIEEEEEEGSARIKSLMFAYSPIKQPLYTDTHFPQCPQDVKPLCIVHFINEVRPEIIKAVKIFKDENISLKLLTGNDPNNTIKLANQLGIIETTNLSDSVTLGEDVSRFSSSELQKDVIDKTVFARLNSEQMVQIIKALQAQGEHVAVLGTSPRDLPIMHSANLSITRRGSSANVLNQANLIVIRNSLNALPDALQKGQRIVNGVLDVLKINLTRIAYTLILLVMMYITGTRVFYYHPVQGGMISFFTIILPSIALSLWASTKTVESKKMTRLLFHFILPSAVVTSLAILMIDLIFKTAGASNSYAQLAVTHALVLMGLMTIVFVQPPLQILAAGDDFSGRWEPTLAALGFYILFHILTIIPLAQRLLRLGPLQSLQDYFLIFMVTFLWAVLLMGLWRILWPERFRRTGQKPDVEASNVINQPHT